MSLFKKSIQMVVYFHGFPTSKYDTIPHCVYCIYQERMEFTKLEGDSYDSVLRLMMAFTQTLLLKWNS